MTAAAEPVSISEAAKPEDRVRSTAPVVAVAIVVAFIVILVGIFAAIKPMMASISEAKAAREVAEQDTQDFTFATQDLEVKRDNIIEQYDAIKVFSEQYPASVEQDTLFRDLENSAIFATTRIESIATAYPELLSEGSYEDGAIVAPEQIVIGAASEEDESGDDEDAEELPTGAVPGTDVAPEDEDSYPLGTIPISLNARVDGSVAFVDDEDVHYVASPYLGHYTFGGTTERERLTMSVAEEHTVESLRETYFADTGTSSAGWSTVFEPNPEMPPYREVENLAEATTSELVELFPTNTAQSTVVTPPEWAENNGYFPLSGLARSAWLINEIHNSPGRAILTRFVAGSHTGITISGQQFILRELPPLPEEIFGDLNGDGIIGDPADNSDIPAEDPDGPVQTSPEPARIEEEQ